MKIGFIAMSGLRVVDRELMELGLSLPGFVERGRTIARLPSLGLLTLAGMTPAHHERHYIEIDDLRAVAALPTDFDLIALSSLSARIDEAYALADRYRRHGVPVVIGGLHATAVPDEAARHCDAVVVGEGESSWLELLRDAERNRLQDIYRPTAEFPMAEAPMPAFELLDVEKYNRLTVQATRGCPLRCAFCASSITQTAQYKRKPVKRVLAEIDRIREIWKRPFLEFADDNAFADREYWRQLLPGLTERKVRWFAETDLSIHRDGELLESMRESGCAELLIGLESPDAADLHGLELRTDWKFRRFGEYSEAIANIQSRGIRVNGCFILGLDEQDTGVFDRVCRFAEETELFDVQITILTPFPGTPLYDRFDREGRLLDARAWERCTLFDLNHVPRGMSPEELRDGFRELTRRLYDEEATRLRRSNFKQRSLSRRRERRGVR